MIANSLFMVLVALVCNFLPTAAYCVNKIVEAVDLICYLRTGEHELRSYELAPRKIDFKDTNLVYNVAFKPHSIRPCRIMMEFDRETTRIICQRLAVVHSGVECISIGLKVKIFVRHCTDGLEITTEKNMEMINPLIVFGSVNLLKIDLGVLNPADFRWFFTDKIDVQVQVLDVPPLLRGLPREGVSLNLIVYPPLY